jgi:hypothetical protein
MKKTYVGIDIGKRGAIAVIYPDRSIKTIKMPMTNEDINYQSLFTLLSQTASIDAHVVFEKLGVIFGTTKTTAFSMGYQAGAMEMACIAFKAPYTKVRAVDWQKYMFEGIPDILKEGTKRRDTKAMALQAIRKWFPGLKLTFGEKATVPHDGLIDAVLIAEYARKHDL